MPVTFLCHLPDFMSEHIEKVKTKIGGLEIRKKKIQRGGAQSRIEGKKFNMTRDLVQPPTLRPRSSKVWEEMKVPERPFPWLEKPDSQYHQNHSGKVRK